MYIIATPEEAQRFFKETETVIHMNGQTSALVKTIHYFNMVLKDLVDENTSFTVYKGSYTIDVGQLTINRIKAVDEALMKTFGGLHELIATTTLDRFTKLAKANRCERLVIFSKEVPLIEMMFEKKFDLVKFTNPEFEVRGALKL